MCSGGGSTQGAQCAGVGWLIGLGRLAIGRRVYVLWLSLEGWNGRARRLESAQFAARTYTL